MSDRPETLPRSSMIAGFSEERLATILLFIAPFCFATNVLVAKATADLIPPVHLAFLRWAVTFCLLVPFVGRQFWEERLVMLREWKDLLILGILGMGICGAFVYIAADTTTATNIGLIYSASPVLIILVSTLYYKEQLRPLGFVGLLLSLVGVLIIICRGEFSVLRSLAFTEGDLWIVVAMISWAVYSIILRHRPSRLGLSTRLAAIILAGVIVLAPFTAWEAYQGDVPDWTLETVAWIAFLAVVGSLGSYQLYGYVQRTLGAGRTSLLLYLVPVYNVVLAWALLGEQPLAYHWIGAGLVLPGLMLATRAQRSRPV